MRTIFVILGFLISMPVFAVDKVAPPSETEARLVAKNLRDADDLILELYREHQILGIAHVSHYSSRPYLLLQKLLENIAGDEEAPIVVIERFGKAAPFYEKLSDETDYKKVIREHKFENEKEKALELCDGPEWAYSIANFMPFVAQLNQKRPVGKKIRVTTVDSAEAKYFDSDKNGKMIQENGESYRPGNCQLPPMSKDIAMPVILFPMSGDREVETKKNFESKIWKVVEPSKGKKKVIVLYHSAHLVRGLETCFAHTTEKEPKKWTSNWLPLPWMSRFLSAHPEMDKLTAIVLADEISLGYTPNGAYRFAYRNGIQLNKDFGVRLTDVAAEVTEKGADLFSPEFFLLPRYQMRGNVMLHQAADALVWSHDSPKKYTLKKPSDYLGAQLCPVEEVEKKE